MSRLIIVSGTPGVGKTVLGKDLAATLGIPFFDVGQLVKAEKLYSDIDRATGSMVVNTRGLRRLFSRRLGDGGLIATHLVADILPKGKVVERVVVLRLDPRKLWRRLRVRGWTRRKAWENVESELVDICFFEAVRAFGERRVFDLDATGKSRTLVVEEALELLETKPKSRTPSVDWLDTYDPVELRRDLGLG